MWKAPLGRRNNKSTLIYMQLVKFKAISILQEVDQKRFEPWRVKKPK
jgi:hypothetical protein